MTLTKEKRKANPDTAAIVKRVDENTRGIAKLCSAEEFLREYATQESVFADIKFPPEIRDAMELMEMGRKALLKQRRLFRAALEENLKEKAARKVAGRQA